MLKVKKPRAKSLLLIDKLRSIINDPTLPWFPSVLSSIDRELSLFQRNQADQVPIRIIKSTVMKSVVIISQYLYSMNKTEELLSKRVEFGDYGKRRLLKLLDQMEREICLLFDSVESMLKQVS